MSDFASDPMDRLPCGCLVTDGSGWILYSNDYFRSRFGHELDDGREWHVSSLLSRASNIMLESYVMPLILHESGCEEVQLEVINGAGDKVPVVVHASLHTDPKERIYWSISRAVDRDRLHQELLDARRALEGKALDLESRLRTDELTGLFNRHELLQRAETIVQATARLQLPLSVITLDVDHFRAINDGHGRTAGDDVLRALGAMFAVHGRKSDVIARFGGDEFVLLLPDTDTDAACAIAERMRGLIKGLDTDDIVVTVSMGIGTAPPGAHASFDELFGLADRALHKAKDAGGDATKFAQVPFPGGHTERISD